MSVLSSQQFATLDNANPEATLDPSASKALPVTDASTTHDEWGTTMGMGE